MASKRKYQQRSPIEANGLARFAHELNADVVEEIAGWSGHPELGRLSAALQSHSNRKSFFDTYAEAMIARHLLSQECELRIEVPTPQGRRSDFEITHDGLTFYLHIKRLDTDRPAKKMLAVSSRLRVLERIARPYVVQVRWDEELTQDQMQRLVKQAGEFLPHSRVGEEMIARDDDGRELGGVRVIAPWEGTHVSVTIGLPSGFVDQAARFRKLMIRAYQQFMPKAINVVLIGSGYVEDETDFETALLGSHIERWDTIPPEGHRVAHGRAADGFWHHQQNPDSHFAGWFLFDSKQSDLDLRFRRRDGVEVDSSLELRLKLLLQSSGL